MRYQLVRVSILSVAFGTLLFGDLPALLPAQNAKPDLSGYWQNDRSQTTSKITPLKNPDPNAPPSPPPPPDANYPNEVIDQEGARLSITVEGKTPKTTTFSIDGKETREENAEGSAVRTWKAQW